MAQGGQIMNIDLQFDRQRDTQRGKSENATLCVRSGAERSLRPRLNHKEHSLRQSGIRDMRIDQRQHRLRISDRGDISIRRTRRLGPKEAANPVRGKTSYLYIMQYTHWRQSTTRRTVNNSVHKRLTVDPSQRTVASPSNVMTWPAHEQYIASMDALYADQLRSSRSLQKSPYKDSVLLEMMLIM